MGQLAVINHEGDTTVEWDPGNADEVAAARRTWDMLVGRKGYSAFEVGDDDEAGGRVSAFAPSLRKVILVPPMAGGALVAGEMC